MTISDGATATDTTIAAFLARHGQQTAQLEPLPSDASARTYTRLKHTNQLLMQDSEDPAGFAAFITLASHLAALGLSVPRVFAAEAATGLALIEDFGTGTYANLLNAGHDETALYSLATDALLHLHKHPDATAVTVPPYAMNFLLREVSVFSEWFVPSLNPALDLASFDTTFRQLWTEAFAPLQGYDSALVLRDFHIDNLMLLDHRSGIQSCGLLDFQGAVSGPAEYDLASLLQDARRDLADGLESKMLHRYLAAAPSSAGTRVQISHRYYLLGAQRHTRLAGQFLRLHKRDGKPGYLAFIPRVLRQLQVALQAAKLHEIENFIDTTLPGWRDAGPALSCPCKD